MAKAKSTMIAEAAQTRLTLEAETVRAAVNYTLAADVAEGTNSTAHDLIVWTIRDRQLREVSRKLARLAPSLIEPDQDVPPMPGRPRKHFIDG